VSRSSGWIGSRFTSALWRLKGAGLPETELVSSLVLRFLPADVLADDRLVAPDRGHEVPASPEMLPDEVPLALPELSGDVDRTLPLDVPHDLRDRDASAGSPSACGRGPA